MVDIKLYNPESKVRVYDSYGRSRDGEIIRYEIRSLPKYDMYGFPNKQKIRIYAYVYYGKEDWSTIICSSDGSLPSFVKLIEEAV